MKKRFWLVVAAFTSCLLFGGLLPGASQTTTTARPGAAAARAAESAPAQECSECEGKCQAWIEKCKEGGQYACYKAASCLCKCNLDAGGCGSAKEALKECYEQNEKLAQELGSPGRR